MEKTLGGLFKSMISGTGSYLPEKELTNHDLEKMVETSNEWILERTGIYKRHIAAANECTSDLALVAAKSALSAANLGPKDIDMILLATVSPDQIMPSTACVLQNKLDCNNCMSLDLSAACSGFLYALSIADQFIKTGRHRHILVVGVEILNNIVSYKDRETCILFGDGAGAVILSRNEHANDERNIYNFHMQADGSLGHLFILPSPGSVHPISEKVISENLHYVKMKGKEIFKHAVRTMTNCCDEVLKCSNANKDDINWLIPHQANTRILESVAKHFDIDMTKVVVTLKETGNTSAASIPIAMDTAIRDGRIKRGHNLLLTAFGAGLTSGSVYLKY